MFTTETSLKEILNSEALYPYGKYMMYANPYNPKDNPAINYDMKLSFTSCIGWSPIGIANGLNFLCNKISSGKTEQFFIYDEYPTQKDTDMDPQMKEVSLLWIKPDKPIASKEPVILVSGGGYQAISVMVDGLPCVQSFSEKGHQVFMLIYRVGDMNILPKALDDLANAINFLNYNAQRFHIDMSKLVIAGFSAGANLVANWQLPEIGYRRYCLQKPKCALLVYGVYDLSNDSQDKALPRVREFMLGDEYMNLYPKYTATLSADSTFPPAFIICGEKDGLVEPMNSIRLKEILDKNGVKSILEIVPDTDHGFGDGSGTKAEGWIERAISFLETLGQ